MIQMVVSDHRGSPSHHPFIIIYTWIFHEINHPAVGVSPYLANPQSPMNRHSRPMSIVLSEPMDASIHRCTILAPGAKIREDVTLAVWNNGGQPQTKKWCFTWGWKWIQVNFISPARGWFDQRYHLRRYSLTLKISNAWMEIVLQPQVNQVNSRASETHLPLGI